MATATAKRLVRLFGFPVHQAPGEAEAECAALQRAGVVDAVLSEDVDALMFGATRMLRSWSSENKGSGPPTHVTLYDMETIKSQVGLDKDGLVLVALMRGGDYMPAGVPGIGPKTACEAAKAGFGASLVALGRSGSRWSAASEKAVAAVAAAEWRTSLAHELRTNESGFFRVRHAALADDLPADFPNLDVLREYTHPKVSSPEAIEALRTSIEWQRPVEIEALRNFTVENFDWTFRIGAVKMIRVLAPSMLAASLVGATSGGLSREQTQDIVKAITSRRTHSSTGGTPELRVSYIPNDIVGYDFEKEPGVDDDSVLDDELDEDEDRDGSAAKANGTSKKGFDPLSPDLTWVPETIVKVGAPERAREFEDAQKAKELAKSRPKTTRGKAAVGSKPAGPTVLDKWVSVTKPTHETAKDVTAAKDMRATKGVAAAKDVTAATDAMAAKDVTAAKDITAAKDVTATKDVTAAKDITAVKDATAVKDVMPSGTLETRDGASPEKTSTPPRPTPQANQRITSKPLAQPRKQPKPSKKPGGSARQQRVQATVPVGANPWAISGSPVVPRVIKPAAGSLPSATAQSKSSLTPISSTNPIILLSSSPPQSRHSDGCGSPSPASHTRQQTDASPLSSNSPSHRRGDGRPEPRIEHVSPTVRPQSSAVRDSAESPVVDYAWPPIISPGAPSSTASATSTLSERLAAITIASSPLQPQPSDEVAGSVSGEIPATVSPSSPSRKRTLQRLDDADAESGVKEAPGGPPRWSGPSLHSSSKHEPAPCAAPFGGDDDDEDDEDDVFGSRDSRRITAVEGAPKKSKSKTKTFIMPRKSNVGYFKHVEIADDEVDTLPPGAEAVEDVSIIDLTSDD